jgi:hypothetical protein
MSLVTRTRAYWTETGTFAREIVAKRAGITTMLSALIGVGVTTGVIPTDLGARASGYVVVGFGILSSLVGILWARQGVTPSNPALSPKLDVPPHVPEHEVGKA